MRFSVPPSLVRFQPVLVGVVPLLVLAAVLVGVIQPRVRAGAAARARLEPLQQRAVSMQRTLATRATTEGNSADVLTEFERRIPADDRVPELLERLAQRALAGTDKEKIQNLMLETGVQVTAPTAAGDGTAPVAELGAERLDPRLELFPKPLSYTPITIGFDSSYGQLGSFFWQLRGLPTLVEIRRVEIGPAAEPSLVHVNLVVVAFQRTEPQRHGQLAVASAGFMSSRLANAAVAGATSGVDAP